MKHMNFCYDSPNGLYRVQWQIHSDGTFSLRAWVPDGCSAEIILPDHPENRRETCRGGEYAVTYRPTVDYLHPFSLDVPVCDLLEHTATADILKRELPTVYGFLTGPDCSLTMESLRALANMLPFVDTADVERTAPLFRQIRI